MLLAAPIANALAKVGIDISSN